MPVEFRCPITQMVMKKPVMATDGHSYELKAMQKWLLKKQTSPVTGKPLVSTNLILNQNLKKLIRDFTSAPKRKAPIDEDLFGGSDDDAPAPRHATAGSSVAATSPMPHAAIDGGASSAAAAPSRKRMKAPRRM